MHIRYLLTLSLLLSSSFLGGKEIVLDKIIARLNGRNILKSHLEEPRLVKNSQPFTLDELITDEVMVQKAAEFNATPTAADLESTFNAEKIAFGGKEMKTEEFEATRLKQLGLTLDQYRNQLYRYIASERLAGGLIAKNVIITAQEIEDYYKKNPVYSPEQFRIMVADYNESKPRPSSDDWKDLGWFEKNEMDDAIAKAVLKLKPGKATTKPIEHNGKLKLVLLKEHKESLPETLSSRYNEIKTILREERSEPFVKNFVTEAKNKAYITYP